MDLSADVSLGVGYSSRTQQARRISEDWVARNCYCFRCDSDRIAPTPANTNSRDFVCERCSHGYELKSKCGAFTSKVLDGAYGAMIRTIREARTPSLLLLEYSSSWTIEGLRVIHHSLITENSIIPRKPLAATARRAGWVGCSISLSAIAIQGQITVMRHGIMEPKQLPRDRFAKLEVISALSSKGRSWAATILWMTNRIVTNRFSLNDVYKFESELEVLFPGNRNIRPKIRQQLQVLRDAGLLKFCGGGIYERIAPAGGTGSIGGMVSK